jgi:hypothetical protein
LPKKAVSPVGEEKLRPQFQKYHHGGAFCRAYNLLPVDRIVQVFDLPYVPPIYISFIPSQNHSSTQLICPVFAASVFSYDQVNPASLLPPNPW